MTRASEHITQHAACSMSNTDRIDGLLGDLQRLTEAGRDRILGFLPQEDLIALLKVALRERDQDRGWSDHHDPKHMSTNTLRKRCHSDSVESKPSC
jgi:hypothetical protein